MRRRTWLKSVGAGLSLIAGCTGSGEPDIEDSDGDGVIDSEDYAPNDPDVQEKSDLVHTDTITRSPTPAPAERSSPSPTPSPSPSPTPTPTSTPTATERSYPDKIVVDDEYWMGSSHIVAYHHAEVDVYVEPEYPATDYDRAKLYVGLYEFPRGSVLDERLSAAFDRADGPSRYSVAIDAGRLDAGRKYHYLVGLVPGSTTEGDLDYAELDTIMETDPFVSGSGDPPVSRTTYDAELADDTGSNYSRNNVEGAYQLHVDGRTFGKDWTVSFFTYKSAHAVAVGRSRGRSRPEYVSFELTDGSAQEIAELLDEDARALGFSGDDAVEFVIDFVQALPYVPDDVSKGFDDYTKFIMETMPEMGGDCEDTSIMLAAILEADAFYYDMILIQPPGHMAAGIWQEDPQGWYWELDDRKYAYIETTGQGWGIGDCPEEYQGADAYLHQV